MYLCRQEHFLFSILNRSILLSDKIIIGSFQGTLRIYKPNGDGGNAVEDVVIEQAFKQPILQVEVGRFSS